MPPHPGHPLSLKLHHKKRIALPFGGVSLCVFAVSFRPFSKRCQVGQVLPKFHQCLGALKAQGLWHALLYI
eukprot:3430519-Amphidinium_carterae.1